MSMNQKDIQVAPGVWQFEEDYEANRRFDEARDEQLIDELSGNKN